MYTFILKKKHVAESCIHLVILFKVKHTAWRHNIILQSDIIYNMFVTYIIAQLLSCISANVFKRMLISSQRFLKCVHYVMITLDISAYTVMMMFMKYVIFTPSFDVLMIYVNNLTLLIKETFYQCHLTHAVYIRMY